MNAFDRIAGYKKEKEELMALAEIFKNRKKLWKPIAVI